MGRLRSGVSSDHARAEFVGLARRLAKENPATNGQLVSAAVQPLLIALTSPQLRRTLYAMLGAVIVVFLIACVNVMNMQFGRAASRSKELATRAALGATRDRLIRQMMTEGLIVALIGAGLGLVSASWMVKLLNRATHVLPFRPYWAVFQIDTLVFAFTIAAMLVAMVASNFVPAFLSSRENIVIMLKEGGSSNTNRLVNVITGLLAIGQIALTAALLIAASLQIKSIRNQMKLDYGYDEQSIYSTRLTLSEGAYPNSEHRQRFVHRALRALRSKPAFTAAATCGQFQMALANFDRYEIDGESYVDDHDRPAGNFDVISDGYFATIGLKILEGRDFTPNDSDAKQPVALVSSSFARKHWGNKSPIGRRLRVFDPVQPQPAHVAVAYHRWCSSRHSIAGAFPADG